MNYRSERHQPHNQSGFTIVELLIIIMVTGAITGLAISISSDNFRKRHNTERQRDILQLQDALEDYYAQNEKYPTLANINDIAWRTKNLKTVGEDQFTDPKSKTAALVSAPQANAYSYAPTTIDGNSCDNVTSDCMKYVLTATQEGAEAYTKNNYN